MDSSSISNFKLKNPASFERFFKTNYHVACMVAMRYMKDEQLAEDIVQETYLNLWEKRNEINIKTNLRHYLLNSVRYKCINYLQREQLRDRLLEPISESSMSMESNNDFLDEEMAVGIAKSIEELPPQCKKIFLFAYRDGMSYNEIANNMGLSKNTIKTQMGIAYKTLREKLRKYMISFFVIPIQKLFK